MKEAIEVLQKAIEAKRREIKELEAAMRKIADDSGISIRKRGRPRKQTGPNPGSLPFSIQEVLKEAGTPLQASEISERLAAQGKNIESRIIASSLNRYIKLERVFRRSDDGLYALRE